MTAIPERHIFFLDDEPQVRNVVKETLEGAGIKVTCFVCPMECLAQLRCQKCDLLITDLRMPDKDGLELLADVKHLAPWVPVLMITGYGDVPTAVKAIKGGAVDFIEKPLTKKAFLQKVRSILQESAAIDGSVGQPLTRTEMNVLRCIIDGRSNRDIADMLHRSVRTVEVHRSHIMRKFGVDNVIDLVKLGVAMGLVNLEANPAPHGMSPESEDSL